MACIVFTNCGDLSYAKDRGHPWLLPATPTLLEWAVLELQANEGDVEYGEDKLTITYYLGPKSVEEGIIYCQILYLPSARAEIVQLVEKGIRERFEYTKKMYTWARLEIVTKVTRKELER